MLRYGGVLFAVRLEQEDGDLGPLNSEAELEAEEGEPLHPLQLPRRPTNLPDPLSPVGAMSSTLLPSLDGLFPLKPLTRSPK